MIPSSRNAVVTCPILFWAALIVGVLPKTAWAQEITARTPSRTAVRQERRDALRDSTSTLKKAIKAGEIWTGLWGLPEDCPSGFSGMPTPGLVTKASYYSSRDPEPGIVFTWRYDRLGNQRDQEIQTKGADGSVRLEGRQCDYEVGGELHKGKLVYMKWTSNWYPVSHDYRATYNARDQLDVEMEEADADVDGIIDEFLYTRYSYDSLGLLTEQIFEFDVDGDGTIDFQSAARATYDADHRMQRLVKGYFDRPGGTFLTYETYVIEVNAADRSTVATTETDFDVDGVIDMTIRSSMFRDAAGRDVRWLYELDYYGRPDGGGDGQFDSVSEDRYEYDAAGNLNYRVSETLVVEPGFIPYREEYWYTYDKANLLIRESYRTDYYVDGTTDGTQTITYTRDQQGKIADELWVWSYDGRNVSYWRTRYRYDGVGNLLEALESSWVNDEPPSIGARRVFEYGAGQSGQDGGDHSNENVR
jgi:hypothetical protein